MKIKLIRALINTMLKSNSGQTLISVMISMGITAIILLVMMQMSSEQTKSMKYFSQKGETVELKSFVAQQMGKAEICQFNLKGKSVSESGFAAQIIDLPTLYNGTSLTSQKLLNVDDKLAGLRVKVVELRDIALVAPLAEGQFTGNLVITFDDTTAVRLIAPLKIRLSFTADMLAGSAAARPISGCSGGSQPGMLTSFCYATKADRWVTPSCENGYYLKSQIKSTDNNWDGYSGICCYGQAADTRPAVAITHLVPGTRGKSYNAIVSMCMASPGTFGNKSVSCPQKDKLP